MNDNPKLKKPLSSEELEKILADEPWIYRDIADNCILALTGIILDQQKKAIQNLESYVPYGQKVYTASKIIGDMREIAWTYEEAPIWQIVTRIPACVISYLIGNKVICITVN